MEAFMRQSIRCLLALVLFANAQSLFAQASITGVRFPNAVAEGGGTGTTGYPYAVFVQISNWTAAASSQAYLKVYSGSNNEYMWSATSVWSNSTTYANANQPVVNIDASGNWSGWIYAKHNNNVGVNLQLRGARVGATSTQVTSTARTVTVMTMTGSGNGGWIFRQSSPAVNKGIVAYSGGQMVGVYRTEDNGITEGYSYGSGGFKIAVPAGVVDSLVAYNDDGSRNQSFVGPWAITAGQETDAGQGGGQIGHGIASISPSTLSGGVSHSMALTIRGESPYTLVSARVAVPSTWTWSHSIGDITLSGGGSPVASIAGDTVVVTDMTVAADDSVRIGFSNITPADSTATFVFQTKTGTHPDSLFSIGAQPGVFVYSTPLPLGDVQQNDANGVPLRNNTLVTVRGIVTVANQFNGPSYIQDNSGGLGVFGSSFSTAVNIGDEVVVSGLVQPFNGLTEIVNPRLHSIVSTGNVIEPQVVTASQIANDGQGGVEQYECHLVRLNNVTVSGTGNWTGNTNYPLSDATGNTEIRIAAATNLVGTPIPAGAFDLIAVVGQFKSTSPFIGGYQLLPRFIADQISSGPIIESLPLESNIQPTSLTISWTTAHEGTTRLRYGTTPLFELGIVGNDTLQTNHVVVLNGLTPATVYYVKAFSFAGTDTSFSSTVIMSTASPAQTTGAITVAFNKSVNTSLAWLQPANGNDNFYNRFIPHIQNAQRSVDVCLYSLSGTVGNNIAQALVAAKNRGVKVRVICEADNQNGSGFTFLAANGIPLITDAFDPINAGAGLMHNKFFVIDGRGGAPDSVWVVTGSWNPTDSGTNTDYQNYVEIQDMALANAYTMEFNEMWGSSTDVPNASNSRFGARKLDNTPHRFVIGGKSIRLYFSPSDRTTSQILGVLNGAEHSIGVQMLTFTRAELASALVAKKNAGKKVRVDLDNNTDTGNQYDYLLSNGVDIHLKTGSGLLHHKYAIIDAENPLWNTITMTGSHNWSSAAENSNNENMLIIYDANITNQYLQEFAARYYQFGGTDSIRTGVNQIDNTIPSAFSLSQNYPNPFNPATKVVYAIPSTQRVTLKVYDILGREVSTLVNEIQTPGTYAVEVNGGALASGVYFYRIEAGSFVQQRKMLLLK